MAVVSEERWMTLKFSLEVKLFQAEKNSIRTGPEAGRKKAGVPRVQRARGSSTEIRIV